MYYFPIFTVYLRLLIGGLTGLFSCSHQDAPSIYDCQRACRAQSLFATKPLLRNYQALPLATTIYDLRAANQSLPMSAVHKQWWLALNLKVGTPAIQILELAIARVRGRSSVDAVAARATSR